MQHKKKGFATDCSPSQSWMSRFYADDWLCCTHCVLARRTHICLVFTWRVLKNSCTTGISPVSKQRCAGLVVLVLCCAVGDLSVGFFGGRSEKKCDSNDAVLVRTGEGMGKQCSMWVIPKSLLTVECFSSLCQTEEPKDSNVKTILCMCA